MSATTCHMSLSLDGYVAPDPGLEPIEVIHSPFATHTRYRIA